MNEFQAQVLANLDSEFHSKNQDLIQRTNLLEEYITEIHQSQIEEIERLNKHYCDYVQTSQVLDSKVQLFGSLESQNQALFKQIKAINLMISDMAAAQKEQKESAPSF